MAAYVFRKCILALNSMKISLLPQVQVTPLTYFKIATMCRNKNMHTTILNGILRKTVLLNEGVRYAYGKVNSPTEKNATGSGSLKFVRNYTNEPGKHSKYKRHINLMDMEIILKPSIIKMIKNVVLTFLIKVYYDPTFSFTTFLQGASKAVEYVSMCLSRENFDSLQDLVTPEALDEIRNNMARMSEHQKRAIHVKTADMYLKFIYEIGMMFDEEDKDKRLFVEIKAIFHAFDGFSDMQSIPPDKFIKYVSSSSDKYYVCNYRFIREFRKGFDEDWTINELNHFSPSDI